MTPPPSVTDNFPTNPALLQHMVSSSSKNTTVITALTATDETFKTSSIHSISSIDKDYQSEYSSHRECCKCMTVNLDAFQSIVCDVKEAIAQGILPKRASSGTSGTYFVQSTAREIVGVFKPHDEEPYSENNPNWKKYLQRIFLPCIFGRNCLLKNSGYMCEAGASFVDRYLKLKMVPRTEIVALAAPSFNYRRSHRRAYLKNGVALPEKLGSFQLFLKDFKDSGSCVKNINAASAPSIKTSAASSVGDASFSTASATKPPSTVDSTKAAFQKAFLFEFQKLVILDYVIRNTDRTFDNWLIYSSQKDSIVKIAAIDHGLAFPHRHPDQYRSYPYSWASLSQAKEPFSEEIKELFLQKLSHIKVWDDLEEGLRAIFGIDQNFHEEVFQRQMSIMRGQIINLISTMQRNETPFDLVRKPMLIVKKTILAPSRMGNAAASGAARRCDSQPDAEESAPKGGRRYHRAKITLKKIIIESKPWFSCY